MKGTEGILDLEIRAARLAATLDARPVLGALWRRMVGLSEASSTMMMENIGVAESDVIRPPLGLSVARGEPQSVRAARATYRMILRPGSFRDDPLAVFDRAVNATRLTELIEDGRGGHVHFPADAEQDMWVHGREVFAAHAPAIFGRAPPPILGAMAVTRLAAACMPEPHPMTERLIFMAAEHELRQDLVFSDPIVARPLDGLDHLVHADWVCPPSLALVRGGLRRWSVERPGARALLIDRLHAVLGLETGRLGPLNAWLQRLEEDFHGKNSLSRRADFARLIQQTPILNAPVAAEALGITDRGARKLIDEAERMGLITQLTARRSYRLWAVPALAEMIRERGGPPLRPPERVDDGAGPAPPGRAQDVEARVESALDEIDSAMAGVDAVLGKYGPGSAKG